MSETSGGCKDGSVALSQLAAGRAQRLVLNFMAGRQPLTLVGTGTIGSVSF